MRSRSKLFSFVAAAVFAASISVFRLQCDDGEIETIWGEKIYLDGKLLAIASSDVMQRLKGVDQSGPPRYFGPKLPAFSRFDHSVGVFALLRKAGAPFIEQAAGLLHDASYTAFSHVCDHLFAKKTGEFTENGYQDSVHMSFLREHAQALAKEIGLSIEDLNPDNNPRLEQALPDMCADRIQYNIHTGVILGRISKDEAAAMVDDVVFEDGKWAFKDPELARRFAMLSLHFTQNFWGADWNVSMNIHLGKALKRAISIGLITESDIYSTDDFVLEKILNCKDEQVKVYLKQCDQQLQKIDGKKYHTEHFVPKFRGIDPLVKREDGSFIRLSEINQEFKKEYDSVKEWCRNGFNVHVLDAE
jgi:HD superfamily phosphohydrolase